MQPKRLSTITDLPISGDPMITFITEDSREVVPGTLFFARQGKEHDGTKFIEEAIKKGAVGVVATTLPNLPREIVGIKVNDLTMASHIIASRFFEIDTYPMKFIGITGTDGKTSFTYIVESLLAKLGKKVGVIGTINARYGKTIIPTANTTPTFLKLHSILNTMKESGIDTIVMEVSSHALHQDRIHGLKFDVAIFSNIKQDHLDYHQTIENYFSAKSLLFTKYLRGNAILNIDDQMIKRLAGKLNTARLFGKNATNADQISNFHFSTSQTTFKLGDQIAKTNLVGEFNIYNVTAAILTLELLGHQREAILAILANTNIKIPGRIEQVAPKIYVDYAHTPNALNKAIDAIRAVSPSPLVTIFGCGGDRDKTKRPLMGKIASEYSDSAIVTSDNPRTESPSSIINEIKDGMIKGHFLAIENRKNAIDLAVRIQRDESILIAGKGHENYQIIGKESHHHDDALEVLKAVNDKRRSLLIIGYGISGKAICNFAKTNNYVVDLHDKSSPLILDTHKSIVKNLISLEELKSFNEDYLNRYDLVIFSPGVNLPENLKRYLERSHRIMNEIDFAYLFCRKPIYAITGTNGKTTTTLMLAHALNSLGVKCIASGNVGYPMTSAIMDDQKYDAYVVELSSFQIETLKYLHYDALIFLNLAPDHLDHYKSVSEYYNAKKKIFKRERANSFSIDGTVAPITTAPQYEEILKEHQKLFIHPENSSAVIYFLEKLGYSKEMITKSLLDFKPPAHRIEYVTKINGTIFYNDSKSTNLHSLQNALNRFSKDDNIHLLLSGKDKEEDYERIIELIQKKVHTAFTSGGANKKLAPFLESKGVTVSRSETLRESLEKAFQTAVSNKVILLSPGLPSFDEFKNFEDRGDQFKKMVLSLRK